MLAQVRTAVLVTVVMIVLTGLVYPLAMTGIATALQIDRIISRCVDIDRMLASGTA